MNKRKGGRENSEDDADVRNYHEKQSTLDSEDQNHQVPVPMAKGKNRPSVTGEMDSDIPAVMQDIMDVNQRATLRKLDTQ